MRASTFSLFLALLLFVEIDALKQGSLDYEDASFWLKAGQENLQHVLSIKNQEKRAKNVIIFIGDGMGLSTVTAGRVKAGQSRGMTGEEYQLAFEKFPNAALSKTYNVDKQVPDSAATATAMFSGVKIRYKVVGLDSSAVYNKCDRQTIKQSTLTTIADWAQESGMDTGFVTTTRVTHATPAALYAHTNNRDWECDTSIPAGHQGCVKDIARQLVEDQPGRNFKVIMGGGAQLLGIPTSDPVNTVCKRGDGKNLGEVWANNNPTGKLVQNYRDLMSIDISNTSKIMGIFASDHMPYHMVKPENTPTLANMTLQAIRLLSKSKNGFVLMVESGKIDIAHHSNYAKLALREVDELDEAVKVALREVKIDETLIIVTADHSHSFTMNGYPTRGNDILGFANNSISPEQKPYETLSYANGPGFYHHRSNKTNVNDTWIAVEEDTGRNEPFYQSFAGKYLPDETHGGEDVGVYAIGPYSHLFRGTFEQNYIAHVMAYAACFKNWPSHCDKAYNFYDVGNSSASLVPTFTLVFAIIQAMWMLLL